MTEPIEVLDNFIESNPDARELKRALAVKLAKIGYKYREIKQILNVSPSFVSKWRSIFDKEDISGLKLGYKGSKGYLSSEEKQDIVKWLKEKDHWMLTELQVHIQEKYGVTYKSNQSYYDLFHQAGISWKKSQKKNPKKDPEQIAAKQKEIQKRMAGWSEEIANGERVVFFVDECHLLWGDTCGYVWGRTDLRVEIPITNEKERQTYYGALNAQTGDMFVQAYPTGNGENTVKFLKYLQDQHPEQAIAIIWDGASYHKYGETRDYLGELNQEKEENDWSITCILLAPHAPEQNPVEDVWLQAKQFVRTYYHDCHTFDDVKKRFVEATHLKTFSFPKMDLYRCLCLI